MPVPEYIRNDLPEGYQEFADIFHDTLVRIKFAAEIDAPVELTGEECQALVFGITVTMLGRGA